MQHHKTWKRILLTAFLTFFVGLFGFNSLAQATTYGLFADVASYQPDDVIFFKSLVTNQVAGVVVKLTQGSADGDAYVNPKAGNQIAAAKAAGLKVSLYHYASYSGTQDAKNEADFFASKISQYGLGKDTVVVDDVEDSSLSNPYGDTVTFQARLASYGYTNQVTYSMASWFWANKLPRTYPIWVANYGVDSPQVDNAAAWQYTNNFNGQHVDMSYDFSGLFTTGGNSSATTDKIVQVKNSIGIPLWNGYGSSKSYAGRYLGNNSRWKICAQIYADGKYWYEIGRNQWIESTDTNWPNGYGNSTTPTADNKVIKVQYMSGYSIALWNGYGASRKFSGRYLKDGSAWKVTRQVFSDGEYWYQIGANQWVEGNYTDNPSGLAAFN
ncbi:GH25 family lysozyme [Schleiferilactobacillus shenzhenensis]|uniref:Lysozyme n=1 Tax=Schleiferilactobacillus shenzhenensis LY-73 TaxID=1231336 RepID=U4TMJ7_9LACO|nr:GH25 family lysozyme [Schleiferilactobacillus shenzhenensis]ERL64650.1 lysozyme [Schleiferilactobacillus shenzhenensis LY-73]